MKNQIDIAKDLAVGIVSFLEKSGQSLTYNSALGIVAKAYGSDNWEAFSLQLEEASSDLQDGLVPWSPAHGPMSNSQHIHSNGAKCPVCGQKDSLDGWEVSLGDGAATQALNCFNCGSEWTNVYNLSGYIDLFSPTDGGALGLALALQSWIAGSGSEMTNEQEEILYELFIDNSESVSLASVNGNDDKTVQDKLISSTESFSATANKEVIISQLTYLVKNIPQKELIAMISEKFTLDPCNLKL
jgi:hypothetical protein